MFLKYKRFVMLSGNLLNTASSPLQGKVFLPLQWEQTSDLSLKQGPSPQTPRPPVLKSTETSTISLCKRTHRPVERLKSRYDRTEDCKNQIVNVGLAKTSIGPGISLISPC